MAVVQLYHLAKGFLRLKPKQGGDDKFGRKKGAEPAKALRHQ
jgi:hypothetical protein